MCSKLCRKDAAAEGSTDAVSLSDAIHGCSSGGGGGRRRLARRKPGGVAPRPQIIISGRRGRVGRIFDREIRLFYQPADGRRRLMQL